MGDVSAMVAELIVAGCSPEVAAKVVASAFVAGVNSATFRGIPVDESAEKRRAKDRERKRISAEIRRNSAESAEIPNSLLSKNIESKKERGRGTRLSAEWVPSEADREFAKQQGWSNSQIDSEAANFRDYWIAKPGSGGVKLDWPATWRKWVRSSKIKPAGIPADPPIADAPGYYAKADSEQLDAWDAWGRETKGKNMPRDKHGGWRVESEWPPGYVPPSRADPPPFVPKLRAM